MSYLLLLQLCLCLCTRELLATSLLTDVQLDKRNKTPIDDGQKQVNTDILRQLVNQETLIRMSQTKNVQMLMKDFKTFKEEQDVLKKEVANLKKHNKHLSDKVKELNMKDIKKLNEQRNVLKEEVDNLKKQNKNLSEKLIELKTNVDETGNDFSLFKNTTSSNLSDLKIEVRYMSITLLDLNKDIQETNKIATSTQDDLQNLSAANIQIEDFQKNLTSRMTELFDSSINDVQRELVETRKSQSNLSSSLASLEAFRINVSNELQREKPSGIYPPTFLSTRTMVKYIHHKVAFSAAMSRSDPSWTSSETLTFPAIIYNIGGGYDKTSGVFTAHVDGLYVFFLSIQSDHAKSFWVAIVVNGKNTVSAMAYNDAHLNIYQTGANLVTHHLVKGDRVWAKCLYCRAVYSDQYYPTAFSGFLI